MKQTTFSPDLQARFAGFLYLIIIVAGGVGYSSGSNLVAWNDAAATARNILASEQVWRLGIAAMLLMLASDVALAVVFYAMFRPVSRVVALYGMAFRLVMAAIIGAALIARFAPAIVLHESHIEGADALALASIKLFEAGFNIALVFFGFDCLAIGWLIFKSTFLPRMLGVLIALAGVCYLANSFLNLVLPDLTVSFDVLLPAYVAELGLCLWLLLVGVNATKWTALAQSG